MADDVPLRPFDRFFAREYRGIVAIARRVVGDGDEAEDIAQDVFSAFARTRDAGDPGAVNWLRTAVVHRALNVIRSRRRRIQRELHDYRLQSALRETGDPQSELDRRERCLLVRKALLRLEAHHAEILALRYGGLSYAEIATTLRVDIAQIGTRLARAERAFRREIERETS